MQSKAPLSRVDHVQIAMPSGAEDAARAFYAGVLRLEELPKPPELAARGGAWFRSGEVAIHLGVDADFRPAKKAHPAFRCGDYGALVQQLRANGIEIVADDHPLAGKAHCYIADPFGNRIELIEN
jgi:catechol 2,3-dioxygenase-like lactoylglutathione lyase family enzyme